MNNIEKASIPEKHLASNPEEVVDARPVTEVVDIREKRTLSPEEIELRVQELKESHPTWQIFYDKNGDPVGLPPGITRKDALFFLGNDGKWYAQNPSAELIKEIKMWRSDW